MVQTIKVNTLKVWYNNSKMLKQKKHFWTRLQDIVYDHKQTTLLLTVGMAVIAAAILGWAFLLNQPVESSAQQQATAKKPAKEAVPAAPNFYSPLTGVKVTDEAATKKQVTAIMIENSPVARPQSGLKEAGVVFEAIAEGGITRFLVLYQEARPGLIGPVRSLRPYYVDWLAGFDASIGHVGGSYFALQEIRNGSYKDIDQFFNGGSYWRSTDRDAPHNVYTNSDKLDALNQKKGFTSSNFKGFPRKLDSPQTPANATKIDIDVSSPTYDVHYDYDANTNSYLRSVGGAPHNDREVGRITPKTVVALKVATSLGFEDGWREQMTTLGFEKAYIFQDGAVIEGLWKKGARREQLQLYNKNAQPIALNAGQAWITVIAPDRAVSWQ